MLNLKNLEEFGADTKTGLSRCAENEALYLRLVGITVQELSKGELGEALAAGDLEKAYHIAHKLKGGVNNLALTPIAAPLCELTDLLRNGCRVIMMHFTLISSAKQTSLLSYRKNEIA